MPDSLDHLIDPTFIIDDSGAILSWNRAAENIYELTRDLVLGVVVSDLIVLEKTVVAWNRLQKCCPSPDARWLGYAIHHSKAGPKFEALWEIVRVENPNNGGPQFLNRMRAVQALPRSRYFVAP